jgi:hypothetical protein
VPKGTRRKLNTVDSPKIGHPPDPGKPAALRTWPLSRPHAVGVWHRVVAAKTRRFKDLSDLRVSDFRAVNTNINRSVNCDLQFTSIIRVVYGSGD